MFVVVVLMIITPEHWGVKLHKQAYWIQVVQTLQAEAYHVRSDFCQQFFFDVLLTVHLSIILEINQLNEQNLLL